MSFGDDELTRDTLLDGRVVLLQPRRGYRAAIDAVLLAAFVPARAGVRVLEIGCGAGAAALCLARRVEGLDLHGLEVQPAYAALARRNAAENALALAVHDGDLRAPPAALRADPFDHVFMNPPFHRAAAASPDPGRAAALHEGEAGIDDWIAAGLRRLRRRGTLSLIHRADRLGAVLAALETRAGGTQVLPIAPRAGVPASRILVRAQKSSRSPLRLYAPFTLHEGSYHSIDRDSYSREAEAVLRSMKAMLPDTR